VTSRDRKKVAAFVEAGLAAECVDTANPDSIVSLCRKYPGLTTVVDSVPPDPEGGDLHLRGVRVLLESLSNHPISRLIYLSTSGVSGVDDGSIVDEKRASNPQTAGAKLRWEFEKLYAASGRPHTVVRLPAIYGPGRGIGVALRDKRYHLIEGDRWSNRIHVDDIVRALAAAIRHHDSLPTLFYFSDDRPALSSEVVEYYCQKFDLNRPPVISLSDARSRGLQTMLSSQRISNDLMKKVLGVTLKYPTFVEGAGVEFE
jgi:nucleoside-diphosphate-sugar epimerase